MTWWKRIVSHVFVIPVHSFKTDRGLDMDIRWEHGRLALNSPNANYSFSALHQVFSTALQQVDIVQAAQSPILNLGMGAGSTVEILREDMGISSPIVSVEQDLQIIDVARAYFNIERHAEHNLVHADALEFLQNDSGQYGLILVDLFIDKSVSSKFLSQEFAQLLDEQLLPNGQVIFNYIGVDLHPMTQFFPEEDYTLLRIQENQMLVYCKTRRS